MKPTHVFQAEEIVAGYDNKTIHPRMLVLLSQVIK